jgi:putative sigma-54 modulation protein
VQVAANGSRVDGRPEGVRMNLNLTGNHLEITPAIRDYVVAKLDRVTRHFDHVIDVSVVLSVNKLRQKIEANLHIRGKDLHAEAIEPDMYAAIDALVDKLDRMVLKAKEKRVADRHERADMKRDPDSWSPDAEAPAAATTRRV